MNNREIKFRAWSGEFGMYGNEDLMLEGYNPIVKTKINGQDLIFMQYTGLKDKNGVEIYEGDIVKEDSLNNNIGSVIFKSGCFILSFNAETDYFLAHYQESGEVIGNIYEHPHLLLDN